MSLFEKKEQVNRLEFRERLRKASPVIPGSGGKIFKKKEIMDIEKDLLGRKSYGSHISKLEFKKALKNMEKERYHAKSAEEKISLDRRARFLKKLGGIK